MICQDEKPDEMTDEMVYDFVYSVNEIFYCMDEIIDFMNETSYDVDEIIYLTRKTHGRKNYEGEIEQI